MKKLDDRGQVTVFLALFFLVLSMALLAMIDIMRCHLGSGLVQEAMEGAAKEVTANYHRNLADRYHLYFLDPRESRSINGDGKEYLDDYLGNFAYTCENLELIQEKSILDNHGEDLRGQILEYMKYKKVEETGQELWKLMGYCRRTEEKQEEAMEEVERVPDLAEPPENVPSAEESGQQEAQEAARWKSLKEILESIMHSGILLYVCDDRAVSNLSMQGENLPSLAESGALNPDTVQKDFQISLDNLQEIKEVLQQKTTSIETIPEMYLLYEYWNSFFRSWQDQQWDYPGALHYEKEYMIAGYQNDHDNLKAVANRIMAMRFAANFAYACQDSGLSSQAELMGLSLGGVLGLPAVADTVKYILLAAISYSESLLDVHSLFAGHKVPAIKDASNWMTSFENVVELLREKTLVREGSTNLAYQEYLNIFIGSSAITDRLHMKMADIMQLNISLEEPGFDMRDCLSTYTWQAGFCCSLWNTGLLSPESHLTLEKQVSCN